MTDEMRPAPNTFRASAAGAAPAAPRFVPPRPVPPAEAQAVAPAASAPPQDEVRPRRRWAWGAMLVYGIALALIVLWPEPVDAKADRIIAKILDIVPLMTYERLEFGSNILLFVPFGLGLGILLRERHRYLITPLAMLTSLVIESAQAILLPNRTPSLFDILANVSGACLGLVLLAAIEAFARRIRARRRTSAAR